MTKSTNTVEATASNSIITDVISRLDEHHIADMATRRAISEKAEKHQIGALFSAVAYSSVSVASLIGASCNYAIGTLDRMRALDNMEAYQELSARGGF